MIMQYRTFEKTGEKISLLGFGTMRLPTNPDKTIDEKEAIKMIRHAIDSGVNYVDTAYAYHDGESEVVLGKALKDGYRDKVFLADKLPMWLVGDAAGQQKKFDEQLKRLETDVIDMYLAHNLNVPLWKLAKKFNTLDFLDKKKAEGKIKHIGFSFHDNISLFKEIIDAYDWDFCQIQLNYMDVEVQAGVEGLKYAAAKGVAVVIMEPLKGGLLTNKLPGNVKRFWEEASIKRTPAEWALRWAADFPEVLTVLSGMSTMSQVEENLKALGDVRPQSLTKEEHDIIKQAYAIYNEMLQYVCTACGYCMPCPQEIDIPGIMEYFNDWFIYAQSPQTKGSYRMFVPEKRRASACTDCKACVERCPQSLNIPEMMVKAADIFDK